MKKRPPQPIDHDMVLAQGDDQHLRDVARMMTVLFGPVGGITVGRLVFVPEGQEYKGPPPGFVAHDLGKGYGPKPKRKK